MWYSVTIEGYIQYHWDVRMDGITLFSGVDPLSESDLVFSHILLVVLSTLSILVALEYYIEVERSVRFILMLLVVFLAYVILVSPISITAIILLPMIILHLLTLALGVSVTFIVKLALAIGAVITFSLAYRLNRVNSE
jgi:hypothetical protein